jgi:hypothetical protein
MQFVEADAVSLAAFVGILVVVIAMFLLGVYASTGREANRSAALATTLKAFGGLSLWLGFLGVMVGSGFIAGQPFPRLWLFFGAANLGGVLLALSPLGRRMASTLPLAALVGFQGFRLPLELVLHHWAAIGTVPETMTWSGQNIDVVSGVAALIVAPLAGRWRGAAWAANVIGLCLLVNVARVAIMSSPLPFAWQLEQPLQRAFHLPYAYILPVCVAGALAGHIILTRRLISR